MTNYWDSYGRFEDLTKVVEVELDNEAYQFNILGLWKGADGYYLGTDSGCSCPTPWENHTKDDLTGPLTANDAREEATSLIDNARSPSRYSTGPREDDVTEFLANIV